MWHVWRRRWAELWPSGHWGMIVDPFCSISERLSVSPWPVSRSVRIAHGRAEASGLKRLGIVGDAQFEKWVFVDVVQRRAVLRRACNRIPLRSALNQ